VRGGRVGGHEEERAVGSRGWGMIVVKGGGVEGAWVGGSEG